MRGNKDKKIINKAAPNKAKKNSMPSGVKVTQVYPKTKKQMKRNGDREENSHKKREELKQYIFVIGELTSREIKRKYARSSLGIIWSVLNPLLTMVVMSLIFSTMFRGSIENFPIYYLTGQIFWTLFSASTNSSMTALVDNKNLLVKAKLPKQTFILSRIYTSLVNFGYTCIAYVLMLVVFRIPLSWSMLLFPIDVIFGLVFSMGIGYMLAVAYVFFADIKYLYSVLLTLWMYMSAIFYPVSRLSDAMQAVIGCNPVYVMIAFARDCVMYGQVPEPMMWIKLIGWGIGSFAAGMLVFRAKENQVMQKI